MLDEEEQEESRVPRKRRLLISSYINKKTQHRPSGVLFPRRYEKEELKIPFLFKQGPLAKPFDIYVHRFTGLIFFNGEVPVYFKYSDTNLERLFFSLDGVYQDAVRTTNFSDLQLEIESFPVVRESRRVHYIKINSSDELQSPSSIPLLSSPFLRMPITRGFRCRRCPNQCARTRRGANDHLKAAHKLHPEELADLFSALMENVCCQSFLSVNSGFSTKPLIVHYDYLGIQKCMAGERHVQHAEYHSNITFINNHPEMNKFRTHFKRLDYRAVHAASYDTSLYTLVLTELMYFNIIYSELLFGDTEEIYRLICTNRILSNSVLELGLPVHLRQERNQHTGADHVGIGAQNVDQNLRPMKSITGIRNEAKIICGMVLAMQELLERYPDRFGRHKDDFDDLSDLMEHMDDFQEVPFSSKEIDSLFHVERRLAYIRIENKVRALHARTGDVGLQAMVLMVKVFNCHLSDLDVAEFLRLQDDMLEVVVDNDAEMLMIEDAINQDDENDDEDESDDEIQDEANRDLVAIDNNIRVDADEDEADEDEDEDRGDDLEDELLNNHNAFLQEFRLNVSRAEQE